MNSTLKDLIYAYLDQLQYEFPYLAWETDENDQIVVWEDDLE